MRSMNCNLRVRGVALPTPWGGEGGGVTIPAVLRAVARRQIPAGRTDTSQPCSSEQPGQTLQQIGQQAWFRPCMPSWGSRDLRWTHYSGIVVGSVVGRSGDSGQVGQPRLTCGWGTAKELRFLRRTSRRRQGEGSASPVRQSATNPGFRTGPPGISNQPRFPRRTSRQSATSIGFRTGPPGN